jgi:hypothetical protein
MASRKCGPTTIADLESAGASMRTMSSILRERLYNVTFMMDKIVNCFGQSSGPCGLGIELGFP